MNTIKDFTTSFSSLTWHAVNLLLWKKILSHSFQNYYRNQTKHTPQGVFYGGSRFTTKGGTRELLDKFKQKFCPWCTFSQFHNHDSLKELIVINSIITKQCPVELSPWITPLCITYLAKIFPLFLSCLLPPTMYGLPYPFPVTYHLGKTKLMGEEPSPVANNKMLIFHTRNTPLLNINIQLL